MGNLWPLPFKREPWIDIINASSSHLALCDKEYTRRYHAEIIVLCVAAAIVVVLAVVKSLTSWKSPLQLVVPVDLLDSTPFHWVYCLILTLWAADTVQDLLNKELYYHSEDNGVLNAAKIFGLSFLVIILRQALLYYPVFACVDFTVPCLGYHIGTLYTLLMGSYEVYLETVRLRGCSHKGPLANIDVAMSLCAKVPVFIGYVVAACWYFWHAITETTLLLFTKYGVKSKGQDYDALEVYKDRVRTLLHKPIRLPTNGINFLLQYLFLGLHYVLPFRTIKSGFQFPLPFVASITMAWIAIYQLTLYVMKVEILNMYKFIDFVDSFNITVDLFSRLFPQSAPRYENIFYDFQSFAEAMLIILPLSTAMSTGMVAFFLMYMTQNFHKHIKKATKGDIYFLVASEPLPSKPYIMALNMMFTSYAIGYQIFTWMLYNVMHFGLISTGLFCYYIFKNFNREATLLWSWFMAPMMWAVALHQFQLALCRYVFYRPNEGDLICIRFKTWYKTLTYLLLFFNFIASLMLAFLRLFSTFLFTCVMMMRIDWDVYMRGLEGWDYGHKVYVGYLYLETTRNNAILRTFVQLLQDSVENRKREDRHQRARKREKRERETLTASWQKSLSLSADSDTETVKLLTDGKPTVQRKKDVQDKARGQRSRRARNLWLVAYTLLCNPQLQSLRERLKTGITLAENME